MLIVLAPCHVDQRVLGPVVSLLRPSVLQTGDTSEGRTGPHLQNLILTAVQRMWALPWILRLPPLTYPQRIEGKVGPEQTMGGKTTSCYGHARRWSSFSSLSFQAPLVPQHISKSLCFEQLFIAFHNWQTFWEFWNSASRGKFVTDHWNPMNIWLNEYIFPINTELKYSEKYSLKIKRKQFYLMSNSVQFAGQQF